MTKITIVAATKNRSVQEIENLPLNIKIIGENKVQEAQKKFPKINRKFEKHLIGHLQSNKIKTAMNLFDVIQSIDSISLATKINKEADKIKHIQKIMLQINISNDPNKFGFLNSEIENSLKEISKLKNLKIIGLMTILKKNSLEKTRKDFQKMNTIFKKYKAQYNLKFLSMGMSQDHKIAIEEGANMIRLGRILFEKDYE